MPNTINEGCSCKKRKVTSINVCLILGISSSSISAGNLMINLAIVIRPNAYARILASSEAVGGIICARKLFKQMSIVESP